VTALRGALAVGRTLPEPPPGAPGPFGLADPNRVRDILGQSGFDDVDFDAIDEPTKTPFGTGPRRRVSRRAEAEAP